MMDTARRCETCRTVLARTSRRDHIYCSATCRQAAYERRRDSRPIAVNSLAELTEVERILVQATREERLVLQVAAAAATRQWRASAWLLDVVALLIERVSKAAILLTALLIHFMARA